MTPRPLCHECRRPLRHPVWAESGLCYGSTCAERMGVVREPVHRDATRTPLRVPSVSAVDPRQVAIAWPDPKYATWPHYYGATPTVSVDYASTPFAEWPWVRAHREARAGDLRHVEGCEGCRDYGVCALHSMERRESKSRRTVITTPNAA